MTAPMTAPMIDRRRLLTTATAGAFLAGPACAAAAKGSEEARLDGLLDRIFKEQLKESPQTVTSLGLDKGGGAWAKSRLDRASSAQVARLIALQKTWLADLQAIDRKRLSGMAAVNYDTVVWQTEVSLAAAERFPYGAPGYSMPYVLSQLTGSYQSVPDFLDTQHGIETRADAEAYLARLNEFATVMNEESDRVAEDEKRGVVPPDFVIDKTLIQMRALRGAPVAQTSLVASVARRTAEKKIAGDWAARAAAIVTGPVWKALDRQIALLDGQRAKATHDAGAWRLPDGEAYYAFATRSNTTTDMSAEEIHQLGLDLVARISAQADEVFRSQGMTEGAVGQRLAALAADPKFVYPNTDAGKAKLLADLNQQMAEVSRRLPQYFGALPKTGLDIRRVPPAIEAGAPGGYYNSGTLDGTRPGAYYINLRDTAETPSWALKTLTYHEGSPGHHLQITLGLETQGLPMLRKAMGFGAYIEGWALYAEQLADEMGMYEGDPFGRIGYYQAALFRAVRLVVDSGMHAKRWSREQAIKYYMDILGEPEGSAVTEIERYCVWPGQACSYMIGKVAWVRLRDAAKARLGARFDIRKFHDAGLLSGSMPLAVLETVIDNWVASQA